MTAAIPPFPHTGPPARYEAPNGVEIPVGVPDDAGSRDPSATTPGGAVTNAYAQMAEMRSDAESPAGYSIGDEMQLPNRNY